MDLLGHGKKEEKAGFILGQYADSIVLGSLGYSSDRSM